MYKYLTVALCVCVLISSAALSAQSPPSAAPASTAAAKFDVHEFVVLGNSVLPVRDIEAAVYPFLGDGKTLSDVEAARAALENLYRARGYTTVFVDIPPQDVVDKSVRLRVTEGRLGRTSISGARYFSEGKILAALPQVQVGSVPNIPALQQELAALNAQTSDRTVIPVLRAGTTPGTMDLALRVQDQLPLHGSLELDNQYTADSRPLRATAALSYSNLFADLDNIALQYQDTPQQLGQVAVFAANYAFHPVGEGIQPSLMYISSNTNVAAVGTLGVLGKGQIAGGRLSFPLLKSSALTESVTLGIDYKHFRDVIGLAGTTALVTPISYVNASLTYLGALRSQAHQGVFSLAVDFGPRGLANSSIAFANKRFEGRANYFYLRGDASWTQQLPFGLRALLRAAGQFTTEPLISNENYSIAGIDGVRGYLEAEELGDSAIKGTAQLQSPQWGHWHQRSIVDALVFYDAGRAVTLDPLPGEPQFVVLRSWGAGIDLVPGGNVTGTLTWAMPLAPGVETREHESRVLFSVRGSF